MPAPGWILGPPCSVTYPRHLYQYLIHIMKIISKLTKSLDSDKKTNETGDVLWDTHIPQCSALVKS